MRNRIVEILEWAAESRAKVPNCGFDELVNLWDDFILPLKATEFPRQVFSAVEVTMIRSVDEAFSAFCNATPQFIPNTEATLAMDEWISVAVLARHALGEMTRKNMSSMGGGGA